ncbi:hypothetical protein [Micrococcus luteus]|uniref:hypothetical protein n=1 Tax=Micrococcus luteus TaxID=1270 RepID=UPI00100AB39F|nr:hypothetical protein [Micrococcus luteus]
MSLDANPFDIQVIQRMLEFCEDGAHWSRRLWQSGTMLIARELVEAGDSSNAVSAHARHMLRDELLERVTFDLGASSPGDRASTRKLIGGKPEALMRPGYAWHLLEDWVRVTRGEYLSRWAKAVRDGVSLPSAETTARLIAAHLMDEGLSATYIHRWLTYRIKYAPSTYSLSGLCEELHEELARGSRSFGILVPLSAHAPLPNPVPSGWLTPTEVREWRKGNVPGSSRIRQHGAILLDIEALDQYSAAEIARERIATIRDRFRVGGRKEIKFAEDMWVADQSDAHAVDPAPRPVKVHAFERLGALWDHSVRPDLEAAIELMAPLERGPAPAAVTGAWAAMESLLIGPGDEGKHVAADRIALILSASYLRAEWTLLAWSHADLAEDALARAINDAETNYDRAALALEAVRAGKKLRLVNPSDKYALNRICCANMEPYRYLSQVRDAIKTSMHGLYRQRNLVSHAGGTMGVAIRPTLGRVSPLVAAGMDRIAHVALTSSYSAIELAAFAAVQHEQLKGKSVEAALRLLEV